MLSLHADYAHICLRKTDLSFFTADFSIHILLDLVDRSFEGASQNTSKSKHAMNSHDCRKFHVGCNCITYCWWGKKNKLKKNIGALVFWKTVKKATNYILWFVNIYRCKYFNWYLLFDHFQKFLQSGVLKKAQVDIHAGVNAFSYKYLN